MKNSTFSNIGAAHFETGRKALLQSTIAYTLGAIEASGWNGEVEVPKAGLNVYKKGVKAYLRHLGADPATLDRHVNTACSMASKFSAYFAGTLAERRTFASNQSLVQAIVASARASGVNSVASLQRLVKTGNAALVQEPDKTPAEIGQEAQDAAQAEADAIAEFINGGELVEVQSFDAAPEFAKPKEVKPQIEGFTFLEEMADKELANLYAAIVSEMEARETETKAIANG